jgi:hypothetical protein
MDARMVPVDLARRAINFINKGQRVFGCEAVPPAAARHKHQWDLFVGPIRTVRLLSTVLSNLLKPVDFVMPL